MAQPPSTSLNQGFYSQCRDDGAEVNFYWEVIGGYAVRSGNEIVIDSLPEVEEALIRLPLLGTIFAALLHQRGLLVLHSSAVEINGQCVVFIGEKGTGKSTTAMTLIGQGNRPVSDDVVAIDLNHTDGPVVLPSFPQFKIWPDVAESLGHNPEELPLVISSMTKRSHRAHEGFSLEPVPLKKIYVLSMGESLSIEPIGSQQALAQLIAHSYMARFGNQLLRGKSAIQHLAQCGKLINEVPVAWLHRQRSLDALYDVACLVENDQ